MKLVDFLRAALVSPELFAALAAAFLTQVFRQDVATLAPKLASVDVGVALTLLGLPLGLIGGTFALGNKVLHPPAGRDILLEWQQYWRLKLRVWLAVAFSVCGAAAFWIGLYLVWRSHPVSGATVGLAGLAAALTALGTIAVASFTVREALDHPSNR